MCAYKSHRLRTTASAPLRGRGWQQRGPQDGAAAGQGFCFFLNLLNQLTGAQDVEMWEAPQRAFHSVQKVKIAILKIAKPLSGCNCETAQLTSEVLLMRSIY